MNKNKKFLLLLLLTSILSYSNDDVKINLETSFKVNPIFNKNENRAFKYDKTTYDFKVIDFNVNFKKHNVDLGLILKSSREDAKLSDWDYIAKKSKNKNHDLMGKLFLKFDKTLDNGLNFKGKFDYYIDDMQSIRVKQDGKILDSRLSEFVDDNGDKNALGNVVADIALSGKVKNAELMFKTMYKANQFDRFDLDESYLKTESLLKYKFNEKENFEFKHNFNYDLKFSHKLFDTFDNDLSEYPDIMEKTYTTKFDENFNLKYMNELNDTTKVSASLNLDHTAFLIGTNKYEDPYTVYYNILDPSLEIKLEKQVLKSLNVTTALENVFKVKHAKYLKTSESSIDKYVTWASYSPKLSVDLMYNPTLNENRELKLGFGTSYEPRMTISPFITNEDNIGHKVQLKTKLDYLEKFDENNKLSLKNIFSTTVGKIVKRLDTLDIENELNIKYESKVNDKFNYSLELKNLLTPKSDPKRVIITELTEQAKLEYKQKYMLTKDLSLENVLYAKNKTTVDINSVETAKTTEGSTENKYRLDFVPTTILHTFASENELKYIKEFDDKFKLTTGSKLNAKLEMFALRHEKMSTYEKEELKKDKMKPVLSDYRQTNYNLGGKVEIIPNVNIEYKILENLVLNAGLDLNLIFAREVVNQIDDKERPDKGTYGEIDKNFEFKELKPTLSFNLKYEW